MARLTPSQLRLKQLSGILTEAGQHDVRNRVRGLPQAAEGQQYFWIFTDQRGPDNLYPVHALSANDADNKMQGEAFFDKGNGVYDSDAGVIVVASDWEQAKQKLAQVFGEFAEEVSDNIEGDAEGSVYYMIQGDFEDGEPVRTQKFTGRQAADQFFAMVHKIGAEETDASSYVYDKPGMNVVFVWGMNKQHAEEEFRQAFGDAAEHVGVEFN